LYFAVGGCKLALPTIIGHKFYEEEEEAEEVEESCAL